jgi:predicted permease
MRRLRAFVRRLGGLVGRMRSDADIHDELAAHLEMMIEEQRRGGLDEAEARRSAAARFGSFPSAVDAYRDRRGLPAVENLWRDLRYGVRLLARTPGFTLAAVISLALGIGANTAMFEVLNALAFQPLPVRAPDELVEVRLSGDGRFGRSTGRNRQVSTPLWEAIREHQTALSGVFAFADTRFNLAPRGEIRYVEGLWVSGEFFSILGVSPVAGRLFTRADDRPGCGFSGAVISHALWQREFGGRPDVVGRMLHVGAERVPVIGVTPAGFFGVEVGRRFDVALPLCASGFTQANHFWLAVMGRLRPGDSLTQAAHGFATLGRDMLERTLPPSYRPEMARKYLAMRFDLAGASAGVSPLRSTYLQPLWVLMGIAGLVLLIASTNLANLMLVRTTEREHEFATRLAIGGSRGRIVQQVVVEALLLAAAGAVLGFLLARWSTAVLVAAVGTAVDPVYLDLSPNWRVLIVTGGVTCATCVLFGLGPALRISRIPAMLPLQGRGAASRRRDAALRRTLAGIQVGLSLVLVFGAGLFARSFQNLSSVESGFRQRDTLVAHIFFRSAEVPEERRAVTYDALLDRLRAIPGVHGAAFTSSPPLSGLFWTTDIEVDGAVTGATNVNQVHRDYFDVMDMQILSGRRFDHRDTRSSPRAAIVSETFARRFLGTRVTGRTVAMPGAPGQPDTVFEIVGIVEDSKYWTVKEDFQPILFIADAQEPQPGLTRRVVIHSSRPPADLMRSVSAVVGQIAPGASLRFNVLRHQILESLLRERLVAMLASAFGLLALVLALVGVYGVMSYTVSRRQGEIGIRVALGARRSQIGAMVFGEALGILVVGLSLGAAAAIGLSRSVRTLLFGIEPGDPAMLVASIAALMVAGVLATARPAWRAASASPMTALRQQ